MKNRIANGEMDKKYREFDKIISQRFMDNWLYCDIFRFMFKLVSRLLKTNFYKTEKRVLCFPVRQRRSGSAGL